MSVIGRFAVNQTVFYIFMINIMLFKTNLYFFSFLSKLFSLKQVKNRSTVLGQYEWVKEFIMQDYVTLMPA